MSRHFISVGNVYSYTLSFWQKAITKYMYFNCSSFPKQIVGQTMNYSCYSKQKCLSSFL